MSLYDHSEIKVRVDRIWEMVFIYSNRVLKDSKLYGFYCIQEAPHPNIHAIVFQLQVFSVIMDLLISQGPDAGVEYDQTRLILNAKEQLTLMERVAAALKADNQEDYNSAIAELEKRAPF